MDMSVYTPAPISAKEAASREDYGDWQTNYEFAKKVCLYLQNKGVTPDVIVEPTCGTGNFIVAALDVFGSIKKVYGIEIFNGYINQTEQKLKEYLNRNRIIHYELYNTNVFTFDFKRIVNDNQHQNILVLGNPPWVTNSGMGRNGGTNLPVKVNINKAKGIEAITGKGNFDIAESVCNLIIDAFSCHHHTHLALLVKSSVVKNILYRQNFRPHRIQDIRQLCFDAKKEFKVAVAASLFECLIGEDCQCLCASYDFYTRRFSHSFGWVNGAFVSNVQDYRKTCFLDGHSPLVWRSGIKHDCSKVMELSLNGSIYYNGLKEVVEVDGQTVFPLLKSSDIGKGMKGVRKYLVLPQSSVSEDTSTLKRTAPKTYAYLLSHAAYFDKRKSIVYRNKPRFSVFGLGSYSFAPYKIVISALYADMVFSLVEPVDGKPVMVDDTCYLLGFDKIEYAKLTLFMLQNDMLKRFIRNICFMDAKRIVSRELLMRINLCQLSKSVDFSSLDISQDTIGEYQKWLYIQSAPNLFSGQVMEETAKKKH
ncbi:MAG: SAM-dependent methyltransferase [Prevotellaceae bacterium]|nr:SAM-dependent methyltransferase [Prevotellaceae bacterium]